MNFIAFMRLFLWHTNLKNRQKSKLKYSFQQRSKKWLFFIPATVNKGLYAAIDFVSPKILMQP